eukprot:2774425-Heterocapsa_arctica.AAC.1
MKKAPKDVRNFLRGHPDDLTEDFGRLKRALHTYRVRGQTYDSVGRVVSEDGERWETQRAPLPMEVDALAWKGKGKGASAPPPGEGKGKGKGKTANAQT